jgi:DNA invertase Pin-like site-specific DNA recombinase
MIKRAAIYARVSSQKQASEEKVSIERQISDCEALCSKKGYQVVAQYVDKRKYRSKGRLVEPSATRSDRPQYKALLQAAHDGEFDLIVAWKQDRLTRGIYSAVPLGRVLEDTGVKVELVMETFDEAMFFIKAAIGKIEIDNIKQRMAMGVQGRLDRGQVWDMHRRYGYDVTEDGQLVHDEERAQWVQKIFNWYLERVPVREIRRRLIESGAPHSNRLSGPQSNKTWHIGTIHRILSDPVYFQGYVEAKRAGETFKIDCPPIVTKAAFDRVQALKTENQSHAEKLVKSDFLCQGLVTCGDGMKWSVRTDRWRSKGVLRRTPLGRYYCNGKNLDPEVYDSSDCPGSIGGKKLDQYVWGEVARLLENPGLVAEALDAKIEQLRQSEQEVESELDRIQRDMDSLAMERQWVITQARKGSITEDDMEMQLVALKIQEGALLKEQAEKSALAEYRKRAQDLAKFAEDYLQDVREGLDFLNQDYSKLSGKERKEVFKGRRRVVKTLVESITMQEDWPPEIVFVIEVDESVSGASCGTCST